MQQCAVYAGCMAGGGTAALHWHGWGWRAVSWHEYVDCIKPKPPWIEHYKTQKHQNLSEKQKWETFI